MPEQFAHGSADFWDRLVVSPETAIPHEPDDRVILAIERLFPSPASDQAKARARARILDTKRPGIDATSVVAFQDALATPRSQSILPASLTRSHRWLAAAMLLVLLGAGLWFAAGRSIWTNWRSDSEHVIPAASDRLGDVPMYGIDPGRSNAGPGPGIERQPTIAWEYPVSGTISAAPIVVDGVAYFGSSSHLPNKPSEVLAVRASDGELIWSKPTEHTLSAGFAASANSIYVVDDGGVLYALDSYTGAERWRTPLRSDEPIEFTWYGSLLLVDGTLVVSSGSPMSVAAGDGNIFVARSSDEWVEGEEHVYAVSPDDGTVRWETTGHADLAGGLFALSLADGSVAWTHPGTPAFLGPSYVDGTVFYGEHASARVIALDAATGREEWQAKLASTDEFDGRSSPSVTSDLVVVATVSGVVVGIDRGNGEIRWRENAVSGHPMVFGKSSVPISGEVAVAGAYSEIAALDLSDQSTLWSLPVSVHSWGSGPLAISDQTIFVATLVESKDTGKLVALRSPP